MVLYSQTTEQLEQSAQRAQRRLTYRPMPTTVRGYKMSRSSEEVLLIVKNVKNKKCEGNLYMMGQRMAWMPATKDTFTVTHNYADIKVQKISPDAKEKIQLQVVLHDGGANTFHFNTPGGRAAQVASRENVKELLQQLLPRFRRKVNSELEEKNKMLQDDPELFQLYKDLVVSGVLTSDEFWANRANKVTNSSKTQQDVGVSAAFLADIKPQTDGCNGLRYNLTADTIESIFKTYPAVKQKHAEYVPDKLSEQEFWTKFFQSHYFHRDRVTLSSKDLFTDCAKTDEQDLKKEMVKPVADPLVDLTAINDDPAGSGYGSLAPEGVPTSANLANASLIRRFNQHSTMVLRVCDQEAPQADPLLANGHTTVNNLVSTNGSSATGHKVGNNNKVTEDPPPNKKAKIREKLEYEDLETKISQNSGPSLKLTHMDRYLHGPTPAMATQYNTSEDALHACQATTQDIIVWQPSLSQVLPSQTAVSVLWELSPGGALMQGHTQQQLHQLVPSQIQDELRHSYSALCELLRHFWSCFPVSSKLLEEKVVRMKSNLDRFQSAKLTPLKDKLHSYHYSMNLCGHLEDLLEAANSKFSLWQTKKLNKKS